MTPSLNVIAELGRLTLLPYEAQLRECPKCGARYTRLPLWLTIFIGIKGTDFKLSYCQGGADPERTFQTPFGEQRVVALCAGISEEHLHLQCMRCGAPLLMHAKP